MRANLEFPLFINEILDVVGGHPTKNLKNTKICAITTDTRDMYPGDLFIALSGKNFDGEDFCDLAKQNGCDYISTRHPDGILVKNTEDALLAITAYYRRKLQLKNVIAITGSVGKTTTKELLYTIMRSSGKAHATSGNYNNYVGLAHTVLTTPKDTEYLIAEIGMNHNGEIGKCSRSITPDIAVITRIGTAHIGNLGTREMIAKAKLEITEGLNKKGSLLVPYGEKLLTKSGGETVSIVDMNANYCLNPIEFSNGKTAFVFAVNGDELLRANALVMGDSNLLALSFSIACAIKSGLEAKDIKDGVRAISGDNFRQKYIKWNRRLIIDDSYNASLESITSSLELMRCFPGRRCAVLGDIHELGSQAESIHFKIGSEAARLGVERLFLHGTFAPFIKKGAVISGIPENAIFLNRELSDIHTTVEAIKERTSPGDVILFKASNACRFGDLINKLTSKEES